MKGARGTPYDCPISWNITTCPHAPVDRRVCARWMKDIGGLRKVKLRGRARVNSCLGFIAFHLLHLRNVLARIDAADLHEAPI
jgi:hypothetical protein